MALSLERDHGRLVVRPRLVPVARYVVGVPVLLGGVGLLYGLGSLLMRGFREGGVDGLLSAALGAWLMTLFALVTLPLGWWLTLGQHYVVIDPQGPRVIEVNDWRLWRRETPAPASVFRAVRVAVEPLNSSPAETDDGDTTWGQQIRLIAREPEHQASVEIGWLPMDARDAAIAAAQQVAQALALPLDVAPADARFTRPGRASES
ncbi:MAG: hypothetical protein IT181_04565 [Acidobacteria bacterium]|nr:hypothetical protein [Acidobacteriota bacterium]